LKEIELVTENDFQDVVHALALSPGFAEDGVAFAACASGLYKSHDGGQTWASAYGSLDLSALLATPAVAISPAFATDRTVFAGVSGAILRSQDGGESWQVSSLPTPAPLVSCLAISPNYADDQVLLAGTIEDGIFRSADRGAHWMLWNFGLYDLHILALALSPNFEEDDTVFAGVESGVFRSTTGGRSWRELPFPGDLAPVLSLAVSHAYQFDGVVFAGTESNGLHKSTDRSQTWARVGAEVITGSVNQILLGSHYPAISHLLVLTSEGLFFSQDAGATWAPWPLDLPEGMEAAAIAAPDEFHPGAPLLIGTAEGRVIRMN
jgi:photosystem II stability/assembly factor-like uncharacterized protein